MNGKRPTLADFLQTRGELHDAHLEALEWSPEAGTVVLRFDDLMSTFAGLEGYTGPEPGQIVLSGVSRLLLDIPQPDQRLHVFSFECSPGNRDATWTATIALWPSGRIEIDHASAAW